MTTNKTQRVTLFINPSVVKHAKTQAIIEDLRLSSFVEKVLFNYLIKETAINKKKTETIKKMEKNDKVKKVIIKSLGVLLIVFAFFSLCAFTVSACNSGCPIETPTPTEIPCSGRCPTETPCSGRCPTETPVPTTTPSPTASTVSSSSSGGGSSSSGGSAACAPSIITTRPIIIESKRIDANTIFVSWGPFAGLNTFIVQYGFQKDNFQFNTKVTGFSTSIGSLPGNQQIFVQVAATDNCVVGPFGPTAAVGGIVTNRVVAFPGTGFRPQNILSDIILPTSVVGFLSFSLVLIKRKKIRLS